VNVASRITFPCLSLTVIWGKVTPKQFKTATTDDSAALVTHQQTYHTAGESTQWPPLLPSKTTYSQFELRWKRKSWKRPHSVTSSSLVTLTSHCAPAQTSNYFACTSLTIISTSTDIQYCPATITTQATLRLRDCTLAPAAQQPIPRASRSQP
jgi:hypothetical protein